MADTVIVALPSEDEKVNKISSEKMAHLTICYLGDQSNNDQLPEIVEYVEHAASQLSPFYATVDRRGELGPDLADVLFFENTSRDLKRVKEFRYFLLQNDAIRRAYDSIPQFPEWTPHLTLGYPEAPAIVDPEDDPPHFYGIQFDRIAVWIGDFQGPEFRLKYDDHAMEVAMSDISTVDRGAQAITELFHYGKKGMKWGVRNDKGHEGETAKTRVIAKADKKFEKAAGDFRTHMKIYNNSIPRANQLLDEVNNKPEYKDADFNTPSPLRAQYHFEVQQTMIQAMTETVQGMGTNASGTRKYNVYFDDDGQFYLSTSEVEHSAINPNDIPIPVTRNKKGLVTKFDSASVSHTDLTFDETLAHYGKKGMKWGVTTVDRASSVTKKQDVAPKKSANEITVSQRKAGTFVKSKGGERQTATDDAIKAQAGRQKAKKSTTDALTNDELKATIERMRLEQEFHKLERKTERQTIGQKIAEVLFGQIGQSAINKAKTKD